MKLFKFVAFVISLCSLALSVSANPATELANKLAKVTAMTASFAQTITDAEGKLLQQSQGIVEVKQPQQLYWETQTPYQHTVITDGKTLWLYDVDLEQATQEPFSGNLAQTPALLLSGDASLIEQTYRVESDAKGYRLLPIDPDNLFSELHLQFDGQYITAMILKDSFGQQTLISLSNVLLNPAIKDSRFHFVPPEGIDVINNES